MAARPRERPEGACLIPRLIPRAKDPKTGPNPATTPVPRTDRGLDRAGLGAYNGIMEIGSVSGPVQGMQRAFDRNAERAKRLSDPENDPQFERDLAELPSDKQDVGVQTKVIKTRDEMLGDLLDIIA